MLRFLRTLSDGRLSMILIETPFASDRGPATSVWQSATTAGPRDLVFSGGRVVHDGHEDTVQQALRLAMEGSVAHRLPFDRTCAIRFAAAAADPAAADDFARFLSVCGRITLAAAAGGFSIRALPACDEAAGFAFVEEMFSTWPFLVGPVLGRDIEYEPRFEKDRRPAMMVKAASALFGALRGSEPGQHGKVARALVDYARLMVQDLADDVVCRTPFCAERLGGDPTRGSDADAVSNADTNALAAFASALKADRVAGFLKRLRARNAGVLPDRAAIGATDSMPNLVRGLALASAVPPDWLPQDLEQLAAFLAVADYLYPIVRDSRGAVGYGALTASSKGRWIDFMQRLLSGFPGGEALPGDVRDMVASFAMQCALPALLHVIALEEPGTRCDPVLRRTVGEAFGTAAAHREGTFLGTVRDGDAVDPSILGWFDSACWKMLFARQSAPSVLEASALWHKAMPVMEATIGTMELNEWRAPFPSIEIAEGVRLVPIRNSTALAEEGAALKHCVGGSAYVEGCLAGNRVIASIRRANADGTEVPTSTVEFTGWRPGERWRPTVVQHRAHSNNDPSGDDAHDLGLALQIIDDMPPTPVRPEPPARPLTLDPVRLLREGFEETRTRLALGTPSPAVDPRRIDPVTRGARYDWLAEKPMQIAFVEWSRFLSRQVRASGVQGFVRHFEAEADPDLMRLIRSRVRRACEGYRPPGLLSVAMLTPGTVLDRVLDSSPLRPLRAAMSSKWWLASTPAAAAVLVALLALQPDLRPATGVSRIAQGGRTDAIPPGRAGGSGGTGVPSAATPTATSALSSLGADQPVRSVPSGGALVTVTPSTSSTLTVTSTSSGTSGTWTSAASPPTVASGQAYACTMDGSGGTICSTSVRAGASGQVVVSTIGGGGGGSVGPHDVKRAESLLAFVANGGAMCNPDGTPARDLGRNGLAAVKVWDKVRYPCARAGDLLAVADGERVAVYFVEGGRRRWVYGARGSGAEFADSWGDVNSYHAWSRWMADRIYNGGLVR